MNRIHTAARTAVAIGAAGVAVLGFAPTASAAGSDTLYVAGNQTAYTYTVNQSPQLQGVAQPNCTVNPTKVTLTISGPGVVNPTIASHVPDCANPLPIAPTDAAVDTAHPVWSGGAPAMNGTYTVTLNNQNRPTPPQVQFTLLIPPAKTSGFKVTPSGTNATFGWSANSEPDIIGYIIKNAAGKVVADPTKACAGTTCSDGPVNLGSAVAGHSEKFSIVAVRSCGGATCSGGMLYPKSAATGSANFAAASTPSPTPTPTPTKTSGSGGKGGNGGSTGSLSDGGTKTGTGGKTGTLSNPGGKTATHHRHKGLGGGLPGIGAGALPNLNLPALPDGIGTSTISAAGEPTTLGKPGGNLKYPAPEVATKKKVRASSGGGGITHEISVAVNEKPLWRGIAAAAVLLLIAIHLRTWAGRTDYV